MKLQTGTISHLDFILSQEARKKFSRFILSWSRDKHLQNLQDPDKHYLIIKTDLDVGIEAIAGYTILSGLQSPHRNIELTRIVIAEPGKGFGKTALKLIQKRVFEEYQAHRLWLDVFEDNQRARWVYESVGFKQEGLLREAVRRGESYDSLVIMSILEQEYFSRLV
ncbi:GNAT family N-acetyltransferase [Leptolyngbya sp. FACHB-671]|uniref:GNAT family N-acetyltransferase n=1 Tax=Leptolyngbya sp. FACHB-671 TaxID=2692812 RepID=UPI00168771DD|nr:GNAT family protein [Leptolyngbya sp. FACHB-671]MBD2067894.1 GNAT family N-acetyltransferase [Leptolyngbya sp. FACHB-671]